MIRAAAIVLSRSIFNIVQARRRNSVKRWHLFLWRVMTRIASICLSILGESCVKSELILGCLFFFILGQNHGKECRGDTTKYQLPVNMVNWANGFCMQKIYLFASWEAIEEETVQSMSSFFSDLQDVWVLHTFLKFSRHDIICSRLLEIKYKYVQ